MPMFSAQVEVVKLVLRVVFERVARLPLLDMPLTWVSLALCGVTGPL
jgi:hypothetical protein